MMLHKRNFARLLAGATLALIVTSARAHDSNFFAFGGDQSQGTSGPNAAAWFVDEDGFTQPALAGLQNPWLLIPVTSAPAGAGRWYAEFPTNVVTYFDPGLPGNVPALQSATLRLVAITPGLEVWLGNARVFAPTGTQTLYGNQFPYPFFGSWHVHFACRARRLGTYTFTFQLTDVVARNGTPLTDSPPYTLTVRTERQPRPGKDPNASPQ